MLLDIENFNNTLKYIIISFIVNFGKNYFFKNYFLQNIINSN